MNIRETVKHVQKHQIPLEREQDWKMRKTKEAIHIRLQGAAMNRDQGTFLSGVNDPLFAKLRKIGRNSRGSQPQVTPRMSTD